MKTRDLFFVFILCQFSNLTNGERTTGSIVKPGYYEIPGTNGLYKYHDTLKNFGDAVATCASEGATLYYADNDYEFSTVIQFWETMRNDFSHTFYYGVLRLDDIFRSVTGIPVTNLYDGWLPGEPNNNGGNENYVDIEKHEKWGLNDGTYEVLKPFICKLAMVDVKCSETTNGPSTAGNIVKRGYYDIPSTKALYKYHDKHSEWEDAAATCAAEGASLYYAENDNEFHTVITYWQNMRNDFPRKFFYGVKKSGSDYKTISGIPISNVYHGWLPGEPNGQDNCMEARNQTFEWGLNDEHCNEKRGFICKWPLVDMICVTPKSNDRSTEGNIGTSSVYHDISGTNGLYKYYDTPMTWENSEATCAAEGASLYYADNDDEFHTVLNYWRTMRNDFPENFNYGVKKYNGVFKTISGIPIFNVFHGWQPNEPNNLGGNENCVEARKIIAPWGLNDKECHTPATFICKSPKIEMQCNGATSIGYKFFEPLGKCYKVHRTPENWVDARTACKAEGSDLAVINSLEEAAHLVRLMNRIDDVPGIFTRGVMLLGFHKINEDWYTVNGQHISNSGYACWGNKQPSGGDAKECGAMFHNGRLNNIECNRKALFICEYDVDDPNVVTEPIGKTIPKLDCNKVYRNIFSYYPFFK